MKHNFNKNVELFMIFNILGDTIRTGLIDWNISRDKLNCIKVHIADLNMILRLIESYLPNILDCKKLYDYILFHDLPEAITGDITKFEGISSEEIERVTKLSIDYLTNKFSETIDLGTILNNYENKVDIESKVVHILDKMHSAIEFIIYQDEKNIDMNNPNIPEILRNHPFVTKLRKEGKDLADIFYEFHSMAICITDEECTKYGISREDGDIIVNVCKGLLDEFYKQKSNKTLQNITNNLPNEAMIYNRNKRN